MKQNNNYVRIIDEDVINIIKNPLPWQNLSGLTILVTGASGFIGGYLVRVLLGLFEQGLVEQPLTVVAMVRNVDRAKRRLFDILENPNLEFVEWDLKQISVPNLINCHYILHAASLASPRFYGVDPIGTLMPNAVGTAALLASLQNCPDPRGFLFVSSSEIYGDVHDGAIKESDGGYINPASLRASYAESKRLGETLCVSWHQQYKLPTFIVRPFHTYGPGLLEEDGRVFSDFVYNVVRGENITIKSDGTARRAFCYISDAIAGIFSVLLNGEPEQPYNVANPDGELSVKELADLLVSLYPEKHLSVIHDHPLDNPNYLKATVSRLLPDVSKIVALGWSPQITPKDGFKRMIEAKLS